MRNKLWHVVDVRDVADALLLIYEVPEASGRHICAPHCISARDLLGLLKNMYPDYPCIAEYASSSSLKRPFSVPVFTRHWNVKSSD
jgi:nucleoside-diphosphate-sugar epimerase